MLNNHLNARQVLRNSSLYNRRSRSLISFDVRSRLWYPVWSDVRGLDNGLPLMERGYGLKTSKDQNCFSSKTSLDSSCHRSFNTPVSSWDDSHEISLTPPSPPPPSSVFPTPGPFLRVRKVDHDLYSETLVVYDLGKREGDGLLTIMKIYAKDKLLKHRETLKNTINHLLVYKRMATFPTGAGRAFVMSLEAAMQDRSHVYFAMELMFNDLENEMSLTDKRPHPSARRWAAQIAMGVSYIHGVGIIHRRICPSTLVIDGFGDLRITDFDNAYMYEKLHLSTLRTYTDETTAHWLPYVAPEAHASRESDKPARYGVAVDYWSLGCVLFELESPLGQAVTSERDIRAYIRNAVQYGEARWPVFRSIGRNARSVIAGLMRVDPYLRFGKNDLYRHSYFDNDDGTNEFDLMMERVMPPRHGSRAYNDFRYCDIPYIFAPTPHYRHLDAPFEEFSWLNPTGIWAPTDQDHIH